MLCVRVYCLCLFVVFCLCFSVVVVVFVSYVFSVCGFVGRCFECVLLFVCVCLLLLLCLFVVMFVCAFFVGVCFGVCACFLLFV